MIEKIGLISAIALPFWNIPLILHIIKRKSSDDISKHWVVGVWICILLMAPSGFVSKDLVWRIYNYVNIFFFTLVVITVFAYRKKNPKSS